MGDWIRKVPHRRSEALLRGSAPSDEHNCLMPDDPAAGPRSIWQCECGQRWRVTVPFWRPLGRPLAATSDAPAPAWLRLIVGEEQAEN